jgi:hypothetical protein
LARFIDRLCLDLEDVVEVYPKSVPFWNCKIVWGRGGQTADFSGVGGESEVCYCGEGDVGDVETFYPLVLLFVL